MNYREVRVGLALAPELKVIFNGDYRDSVGKLFRGEHILTTKDGGLILHPVHKDSSFTVESMRIGINFHWDSTHNLTFHGAIEIIDEGNDAIRIINIVDMEEYLRSVISSEMSADASDALLEAHAIISRSWLFSQMLHSGTEERQFVTSENEVIKWWDKEDHLGFDVCADDHCQRYQGISKALSPQVINAVKKTEGLVLADSNNRLVDARFSKCCGGATELFSSCWDDTDERHECLKSFRDLPDNPPAPPLYDEECAQQWILSTPDAFCAKTSTKILRQVLKDYDQATTDFYRWTEVWDAMELSENIARLFPTARLNRIIGLKPILRGKSGRIKKLEIIGIGGRLSIGKELLIRKALSHTHLYSSAFVIEYGEPDESGFPRTFTLHGAGWGHGVGLCQIGAAVMGNNGYSSQEILNHYFPNSHLEHISKIQGK